MLDIYSIYTYNLSNNYSTAMSCKLSDSRTSTPNCRQSIAMPSKTVKELYFRVTDSDGDLIDLTLAEYTLEAFAKTKTGGDSIAEFNQVNGLFTPITLPATPDDTTANALLVVSLSDELDASLSSYYVDAYFTSNPLSLPDVKPFEHSSFLINIIYK